MIDYLIKLVIKLGRQKPLTMAGPVMEELIAAVTHICTQMTDAAGLSHNLVRLRIAVHLLGLLWQVLLQYPSSFLLIYVISYAAYSVCSRTFALVQFRLYTQFIK